MFDTPDHSVPPMLPSQSARGKKTYEVHSIVDKRVDVQTGKTFYTIKWKGYLERTTKEITSKTFKNAQSAVLAFEERLRKDPRLLIIVDSKHDLKRNN